jgi:hypothetical protein
MKTQIITLITGLVLGLGTVTTAQAAAAKDEATTVLNGISAINKIEVYGNVKLYVSDGSKDQVKVYNKYYHERALVQSGNGVLRITSYNSEQLIVWVTAADLRSISAYDNTEVSSFGELSKIELDVDLHDNATAKLKIESFITNVTVNDQAKVDMSGIIEQYSLKYNRPENVSATTLYARHVTKTLAAQVTKAKTINNDLADLN